MNFSKMDTNEFFFTSKPTKGASSFGVIPESPDIQQIIFDAMVCSNVKISIIPKCKTCMARYVNIVVTAFCIVIK